jgi:hypothetical protein
MKRARLVPSVVVLCVAAVVLLATLPGAAFGASTPTNAECLSCHSRAGAYHDSAYVLPSGTVTFTVGPVDQSTVCAKCHWVGNPGTPGTAMPYRTASHSYSNGTACSGTGCHVAPYAGINGMAVPHSLVASMSSYFYSATSYRVDSATLHRIHANPGWASACNVTTGGPVSGMPPTKKALYSLRCASCHAAASCNDCHCAPSAVTMDHAAHAPQTVPMAVGGGTPPGNQSISTTVTLPQTCIAEACHRLSALTPSGIYDDKSSSVIKTGVWTAVNGNIFYGGSAIKSNSPTATLSVSTTTCTEFELYAFTLPTGGSMVLKVDGSSVGTISCYSATQSGSTLVARMSVPAGRHTISLANTNVAGKGAGKFMTFDVLMTYDVAYDSFRTHACIDCHVLPIQSLRGIDTKDRAVTHGYDADKHHGSQAADVDAAFGQTCGSAGCHTMDLMVDHASAGGCDACHTSLPGAAVTAADFVTSDGSWAASHRCDVCHGRSDIPIAQLTLRPAHFALGADHFSPTTLISGERLGTWTNAPVDFSLSATDNTFGSGVAYTHYSLSGATTAADTVYAGSPVTVSAEGTTTVTFWSVDASGNVETANEAKVLIDAHAPVVAAAPTTPANSAGWYRTDVTAHFSAIDELSGVAVVSPDVVVTGEGASLSASGSSTDTAGNRGTAVLSGIKIDRTAPVTTSDAKESYTGTATITLTAADALSGVARTYYSLDGGVTSHEGTVVVTTTAGQYSLSFWSVDAAGNVEAPHFASYIESPDHAIYPANAFCVGCHSRGGDSYRVPESGTATFSVDPIDYSAACAQCHWVGDASSPIGSHPYTTASHSYAGSNCTGSGCHSAPFGSLNGMAVPHSYVASMGSYFYSATSYQVDAETLHRLHENPRWPASADIVLGGKIPGQASRTALYSLRCASCHAAVSCAACHTGISPDHRSHAGATIAGTFGTGAPGSQANLNVIGVQSCTTAACHLPAAVSTGTVHEFEGSTVAKTGAWTAVTGVVFGNGSASKSNANPGSVALSVPPVVSGTGFSYYGFQLPTGGSALVQVDGSTVATVSFYATAQSGSVELYRGTLTAGSHIISIVNTQLAGKGGGKFITGDYIAVRAAPYRGVNGPFRPACGAWGCHIDRVVDHGGTTEMASHVASCTQDCHAADLVTIHAPAGLGCAECHAIAASRGVTSEACSGCHGMQHAAAKSGNSWCWDCHGASASSMSAVASAAAYGNAGGDHQTGYASSAHGSSVLAGDASGVQCRACHTHSSTAVAKIDYRSSGTGDSQEALCYRCHSASSAETASAGSAPFSWNGRDVQAEFSRVSHHPVGATSGASTSHAATITAFAQSTAAQFALDSNVRVSAMATVGAVLSQGTRNVSPGTRRVMFYLPQGSQTLNQFEPISDTWNWWGFSPATPLVYTMPYQNTAVTVGNKVYFSMLGYGPYRYVYTPPTTPGGAGTWAEAHRMPEYNEYPIGATTDEVHDNGYYLLSNGDIQRWTLSSDYMDWYGLISPMEHGYWFYSSALAYSPEADRLFVVRRNNPPEKDGLLYYCQGPGGVGSNTPFTNTGEFLSHDTATAMLERITKGGHDYLMCVGANHSGVFTTQLVSDLTSSQPTFRDLNTSPGFSGRPFYIKWDGGDYLYGICSPDAPAVLARIKIPADPANGDWGSWEFVGGTNRPAGISGGAISFANVPLANTSVTGYWATGTVSADVDAPVGSSNWGTLTWEGTKLPATFIDITVRGLSGGTWTALPGLTGVTANSIDLSGVSARTYPKLRLIAKLSSENASRTPVLSAWWVTANAQIQDAASAASLTCANCHNTHTVGAGSGSAWDVSRVSDPANTKLTPSSTTAFCLGCHSERVVQPAKTASTLVPYGVAFSGVGANALFPGWSKDTGSLSFYSSGHFTTSGTKALCENCHDPHGSANARLTAWTRPAGFTSGVAGVRDSGTAAAGDTLCLQCHGNGTVGRSAPGAQDVATPMSGQYGHVSSSTSSHSDTETVADLATNRHAECVDCHDPHAAAAGTHLAGTGRPDAALRGATVVIPSWSGTPWSTADTYTPSRFTGAAGEYEAALCFKCHNGLSSGRTVTRSDATTYVATDLSQEFNPSNASYHNVTGQSTGVRETFTMNGVTFTWPWDASRVLKPGWTKDSKVACTDCHTSGGGTAAAGPHGGTQAWALDPAYPGDWRTAKLSPTSDTGVDQPIVCTKCHIFGIGQWDFTRSNNAHRFHQGYECNYCHISIPHGWKRPRLLGYTTDPEPYRVREGGITAVSMRDKPYMDYWTNSDCSAGCYHTGVNDGKPSMP